MAYRLLEEQITCHTRHVLRQPARDTSVSLAPDAYGRPLSRSTDGPGNSVSAVMAWRGLPKWEKWLWSATPLRGGKGEAGKQPHGHLHQSIFLQLAIEGRHTNRQLTGGCLPVPGVMLQGLGNGFAFDLGHSGGGR